MTGLGTFGLAAYENPFPQGEFVVEFYGLWYFLEFKKTSFGSGKPTVAPPSNSLIGDAEIEIVKP